MDPFWCITLSTLLIAKFWKRERTKSRERKEAQARWEARQARIKTPEQKEAEKLQKEINKQRDKDVAELRKQGFDEELITTIIPTINNGQ